MSDLILPCVSHPEWGQAMIGTPFFTRCSCRCWLAALYVFGFGPCFEESGGPGTGRTGQTVVRLISIRSSAQAGSSIVVPIDSLLFSHADCSDGGSVDTTIALKVGRDTGGAWVPVGTISAEGSTLHVYLNSFNPTSSPDYCGQPEYAIPLAYDLVSGTSRTPGFVKWRDALARALADTPVAGTVTVEGTGGSLSRRVYCDPPVDLEVPLPAVNTCLINSYDQPTRKKRSFNNAVFTTPAGPYTTDDLFDLIVTYVNPFTGLPIDGTHHYGDAQEEDVDTVPKIALVSPVDLCEELDHGAIVRLGFGNYKIKNIQFFTQAGTRRLQVAPNFENATFITVSQFFIESGDITITPGAPSWVDLVPPGTPPAFPAPITAQATILNAGNPLQARIMDDVGGFCLYNVVPTATNTVVAALSEPATNYLASPLLNGTTSRAAVAGIASFNDLSIHGLGRNYRITFSSSGLSGSHNANGRILDLSVATDLVFQALPTIHAGVACSILVDLKDAAGTVLSPTTADSLTLSGAGSFSGFGTVAPVAGTATFSGTFPAAGTYLIQVVTSGTHYDGPGVAGIAARTISVTVLP